MVDVTLALSYFDLTAPKLGLGTCWAGIVEGALRHPRQSGRRWGSRKATRITIP